MYYFTQYYIGQKNEVKKRKWTGYYGTWGDFLQHLLKNWDSQVDNLFSFPVGVSGVTKNIATNAEVDQIGVVRADGNILKYYEGADQEGKTIGTITRIPKNYGLGLVTEDTQ